MVLENIANKKSSARGGTRHGRGASRSQTSPWDLPLVKRIQMALQSSRKSQQPLTGVGGADSTAPAEGASSHSKDADSLSDDAKNKKEPGTIVSGDTNIMQDESAPHRLASTSTAITQVDLAPDNQQSAEEPQVPTAGADGEVEHVIQDIPVVDRSETSAVVPDAPSMSESATSNILECGFLSDSNVSVTTVSNVSQADCLTVDDGGKEMTSTVNEGTSGSLTVPVSQVTSDVPSSTKSIDGDTASAKVTPETEAASEEQVISADGSPVLPDVEQIPSSLVTCEDSSAPENNSAITTSSTGESESASSLATGSGDHRSEETVTADDSTACLIHPQTENSSGEPLLDGSKSVSQPESADSTGSTDAAQDLGIPSSDLLSNLECNIKEVQAEVPIVDTAMATCGADVKIKRRGRPPKRSKRRSMQLPAPLDPAEIADSDSNPSSEASSQADVIESYTSLLEPGSSTTQHQDKQLATAAMLPLISASAPETSLGTESCVSSVVQDDLIGPPDVDKVDHVSVVNSEKMAPPVKVKPKPERVRGKRRSMQILEPVLSEEIVEESARVAIEGTKDGGEMVPIDTVDTSRRGKNNGRRGVLHRRRSAALAVPLLDTGGANPDICEDVSVDRTVTKEPTEEDQGDVNTVTLSRGSSSSARRGRQGTRRRRSSPIASPQLEAKSASTTQDDCTPSTSQSSVSVDSDTHDAEPIASTSVTSRRGRPSKAARRTSSRAKKVAEDLPSSCSDSSNDSTKGDDSGAPGDSAGAPPVITVPPELQDVLREEDFIKLLEDDSDLPPLGGHPCLPEKSRKIKQNRGRRRSADHNLSPSNILVSPSELMGDSDVLTDLPELPVRRSGRIKRRSIEIFRRGLIEEDEPMDTPTPPDAKKNAKDQVVVIEPPIANLQPQFAQCDKSPNNTAQDSKLDTSDNGNKVVGNDSSSAGLEILESTSKVTKRSRKRKNETSVEDIYLNKLWRSQMPREKVWETIYEQPQVKFNVERYQSLKRSKRNINFDDFHTQVRMKRRRQKAVKNGWKPLTAKRDEAAAKLLEERLAVLESLDDSSEDVQEGDDSEQPEMNEVMQETIEEETAVQSPGSTTHETTASVNQPAEIEKPTPDTSDILQTPDTKPKARLDDKDSPVGDIDSVAVTGSDSTQSDVLDSTLNRSDSAKLGVSDSTLNVSDSTLLGVSADSTLIYEHVDSSAVETNSQHGGDIGPCETAASRTMATAESSSIETPMKSDPDADTDIFYTPARSVTDLAKFASIDDPVTPTLCQLNVDNLTTPDAKQSLDTSVSPGY